jgi:hypothetical protein
MLLDLGTRHHQATLENTQRKTTQAPAARVKPVRPLCQTGQTDFARLSQKPTHRNWSDLFPKPVTPVSPRELKLNIPKLEQTNSKLGETWTRGLLMQRTTCLPKIFPNSHCDQNRSDLFPKPVRPVSPRQTGKTQPTETTSSSNQSISRFTQQIATKLRGEVDYL